jgi:hypothetical protein
MLKPTYEQIITFITNCIDYNEELQTIWLDDGDEYAIVSSDDCSNDILADGFASDLEADRAIDEYYDIYLASLEPKLVHTISNNASVVIYEVANDADSMLIGFVGSYRMIPSWSAIGYKNGESIVFWDNDEYLLSNFMRVEG